MRILHFRIFILDLMAWEKVYGYISSNDGKLQEINQEENIDLVIFSGDMIDKGGKDFNISLDECFKILRRISLNLLLSHCI